MPMKRTPIKRKPTAKKRHQAVHAEAPEFEMVDELVAVFKVLRSDASAAVKTAITKKANLGDMRIALKTTLERHAIRPFEKPVAFWITEAANVAAGTPSPALEKPEAARSWTDVVGERGGGMKSIGTLLKSKLENLPPAVDGSGFAASSEGEKEEPACARCGDAGYVRKAITDRAHPDFGKVFSCGCTTETLEQRVAKVKAWSGLTPLQMEMRLKGTELVPGVKEAIDVCLALLKGDILQIVFEAPPGRGKTRLAVATLMEHLLKGEKGLYVNVARFLQELRSTYDDNAPDSYMQVIRPAQTWPLVVLDDLGGEKSSKWTEQVLYEIIDARYQAGLRTIACTNADPYKMDDRIVSRLLDVSRGVVIRFDAKQTKDYRLTGGR